MLERIHICFNLFALISLAQSRCQVPVPNIEALNLTSCEINELTPDYFGANNETNLSSVMIIDLSDNRLNTIGNASFIQVNNLVYLDLSNNFIDRLEKGAFQGLQKLKTLILDKNHLTFVDLEVFEPCIRLLTLDMQKNLVKYITSPPNALLSVQNFDVCFNDLDDISPISHFPYLKNLWLDGNRNLSISQNTFSKNPKLYFLDLAGISQGADIRFLTSTRLLYKLCLDRNNLAGLKFGNLPTLHDLEKLQIGGCNLDEIDFQILKQKFPSLKKIYKAGNKFGCWHSKQFEKYLDKNNIEIIRKKPTLYDIDDDMSCVLNSFEITMLLILVVVVIGVLIGIYCIVRVVFVRCSTSNNEQSTDQPDYEFLALENVCTEGQYVTMTSRVNHHYL